MVVQSEGGVNKMEDEYMVITEMHDENGDISYWYYGVYDSRNKANDVADSFLNIYPCYKMVISAKEAKQWGIRNLPHEYR